MMTDNFDKCGVIENEISLINLEAYLLNFQAEELINSGLKNIFNFDVKEFDKIKAKLKEMKDVGEVLNDKDILKFFEDRINVYYFK